MRTRLTELLGVVHPIVQAGMVWNSGWRLAAAVSEAGGLGLIGAGSMDAELLREHIGKARTATAKPFGVNIPLLYRHAEEQVRLCLEEGVRVVVSSAGSPKRVVPALRSEGVTVLRSAHYIEEAERLCDDVAVVSHGRVIAQGAPAVLVAEHAGVEALEVFGTPDRLATVEADMAALGFATRRTGPSVSILRAEALPQHVVDDLPEALRRPANLEDVFVLLTGEKLEG